MTAIRRQNANFVAEDWQRVYEAIQNVDFRAYDQENYVTAIMGYLAQNHPDQFNDWIASSELVMKIEVLTWLTQNISYRVDLNTRENFLATAERRNSLLLLAQNIAYKVNRVQSASGEVKVTSLQTDQPLTDLDGVDLRNRIVAWDDPSNENWFDQFVTILNGAFAPRTPYGKPVASFSTQGTSTDQYLLQSASPNDGSYPFSVVTSVATTLFELYNSDLDTTTGAYSELPPGTARAMRLFYKRDGNGFGSAGSGFFLPIKQGTTLSQDESFDTPTPVQTVTLSASNINNTDVYVQELAGDGSVIADWTQVNSVFGEGVSFDPSAVTSQKIFEVDTLLNDQVRVRFGDGTFGQIPVGNFRIWVRTADPAPTVIKSNSVQNQIIVLPYVGQDQQVYYLRVAFSLTRDLDNGAAGDSNADIQTRANKVFYTQNRMVTGQDLNNWFLTDSAIRKVTVVNRTYSGHSRYSKLHDPTGLYENVRELAGDGRLFQNDTLAIQFLSADTDRLSFKQIMDEYVATALAKSDKSQLYYGMYPEFFSSTTVEYRWKQTSVIGTQALGNFTRGGTVIPVGQTVTNAGAMRFVGADTIFRYDSATGPLAHIVRMVGDGSAPNGIILGEVIPDNTKIYAIFPPFRSTLSLAEKSQVISRLADHKNFGLRWDQNTQAWTIVEFNNLDITDGFDLTYSGDNTNTFKDSSWMIRFEYVADSLNGDRWKMVDRGLAMFFESAKEIDFTYINSEPVVDPTTGQVKHDTVQILGCNEAKTSLHRRGLQSVDDKPCQANAYEYNGDGAQQCFQTSDTLDKEKIIVSVDGQYKVFGVDFTITQSIFGDSICFVTAPADGSAIVIRVSSDLLPANLRVFLYTVFDSSQTEFDLYQPNIISPNMLVFVDGVLQNPNLNFGVGTFEADASLVMAEALGTGTKIAVHYAGNIDSSVFTITNTNADGTLTAITIPTQNQTMDTVMVCIDGVVQEMNKYTLTPTINGTVVTLTTAPAAGTVVGIWSITNTILSSTKRRDFTADGTATDFVLSDFITLNPENLIVTVQGIYQIGSYGSGSAAYSIVNGNTVRFASAPPAGPVCIFVIAGFSGILTNPKNRTLVVNQKPLSVTGCAVQWLVDDIDLWVSGELFNDDGYVNPNGVLVEPSDLDQDGFHDNPFVYRDLVIQDGFTDLILWRRTQELGRNVWSPINDQTNPKGTYGRSNSGKPASGDTLAVGVNDGDIHYDYTTGMWLVADTITQTWLTAANQTAFKKAVGRDDLRFIWYHYAPDTRYIDPSPGNIHDAFLLTAGYYQDYQNWINNNGSSNSEPDAPTPDQLRVQFVDHLQFKMLSDSIIFHSTRFKPLFGPQAIPELQAVFKVIPIQGISTGDNQLRTMVLDAISNFFDITKWDFGESFYFTELSAYVHTQMASLIQSFVIVPRSTGQAFGKLFQVSSANDELFISAAQIEDIEIVSSLTDDELQIGTL